MFYGVDGWWCDKSHNVLWQEGVWFSVRETGNQIKGAPRMSKLDVWIQSLMIALLLASICQSSFTPFLCVVFCICKSLYIYWKLVATFFNHITTSIAAIFKPGCWHNSYFNRVHLIYELRCLTLSPYWMLIFYADCPAPLNGAESLSCPPQRWRLGDTYDFCPFCSSDGRNADYALFSVQRQKLSGRSTAVDTPPNQVGGALRGSAGSWAFGPWWCAAHLGPGRQRSLRVAWGCRPRGRDRSGKFLRRHWDAWPLQVLANLISP